MKFLCIPWPAQREKKRSDYFCIYIPSPLTVNPCMSSSCSKHSKISNVSCKPTGTALCSPIWLGGVLCYCFRKSRELNWYPLVLGWVHSIPTILDFLLKKFHFLPTLDCTRICVHPAVQPYCSPCTITAQFWKGETLTFCSGRGAVRGQRAGTVHSWRLWPYFTLCVWTHCGAHLSRKTTVKLC